MKVRQIIAAFMMTAVICGCSKDGSGDELSDCMITFCPEISVISKATPTGESDIDRINVTAVRSNDGTTYFNDTAVKESGSSPAKFLFGDEHWWIYGTPLDFFAYTPSESASGYAVDNASKTISFDFAPSGDDFTEVLTGIITSLEVQNTDFGRVDLVMKHTMSLVDFAVAYEDDGNGGRKALISDDIIIKSVGINSLSNGGSCEVTPDAIS